MSTTKIEITFKVPRSKATVAGRGRVERNLLRPSCLDGFGYGMIRNFGFILLGCALVFVSCDGPETISPEEYRRAEIASAAAIKELQDKLVEVPNGWATLYRPNAKSGGSYSLVLDFDADGSVRIQSDASFGAGSYLDHTIRWRVSHLRKARLIFESYGLFHFFSERDRARYGGEHEFSYNGEENGELIFTSDTDYLLQTGLTTMKFRARSEGESDVIVPEILLAFEAFGQRPFEGWGPPNIFLEVHIIDLGITLIWEMDTAERILEIHAAYTEDSSTNEFSFIEFGEDAVLEVPFGISGNEIIFSTPLSIPSSTADGDPSVMASLNITLVSNVSSWGFCSLDEPGADQGAPYLEGDGGPGIGAVTIRPSLYSKAGFEFIDFEKTYDFYIRTEFFFLPGAAEGVKLEQNFDMIGLDPEALPFANQIRLLQLYYNVSPGDTELKQQPPSGFGFILSGGRVILRGLEMSRTGNLYHMEFTDEIYSSDKRIGAQNIEFFKSIVDVMFESGDFYVFDSMVDGVFTILDPCSGFHGFLAQKEL